LLDTLGGARSHDLQVAQCGVGFLEKLLDLFGVTGIPRIPKAFLNLRDAALSLVRRESLGELQQVPINGERV
jgi:hypothetical protein